MKKSTYQKQKDQIAQLEQDIKILVLSPSFVEIDMVKMKYQAKYNFEEGILMGNCRQRKYIENGISFTEITSPEGILTMIDLPKEFQEHNPPLKTETWSNSIINMNNPLNPHTHDDNSNHFTKRFIAKEYLP